MRLPRYLLILQLAAFVLPVCAPLVHAQIRSERRGVSANNLSSDQVAILAPGVSWVYNWGATPGAIAVNGEMEFLPMVWGQNAGTLDAVKAYLDGGATPTAILGLNEPNLRGQAFITPEASAQWMKQIHDTLAGYGLPLIGPQMSLGSAPADSIVAYDPIQQTTVTYTSMEPFLDAFDYYLEDGVIDGISVHPYGNAGELKWAVETAYARYGKPVWVTEFAYWDAPDDDAEFAYMVEVLDYLEHSEKVGRYAWFKADLGSRSKLSLLLSGGATLTRLGRLYVNYPAFDPAHYYPVPGKIEAESYVAKEGLSIAVAERDEGMGALYGGRSYGSADFQIDVAAAGAYRLKVRLSSDYYSDLPDSGDPDAPVGTERDVFFTLHLEAGPQTFRLLVKGLSGKIDWLEFEPAP